MNKRIITIPSLMLISNLLFAQAGKLPVKEWASDVNTPLVIYISGDGGLNNFSTSLCNTIHSSGYFITAINAKSYFSEKKTPEQTTADITGYLTNHLNKRKNQQFILVGYSFGADVLPFIVNKLADSVRKKLVSVVLLSPSATTDFETHIWDELGGHKKRSMDVADAINKMVAPKTVIIFGDDETEFPYKKISIKNYSTEILPGGHHFDGKIDLVAKTMIKYFK